MSGMAHSFTSPQKNEQVIELDWDKINSQEQDFKIEVIEDSQTLEIQDS